MRTRFSPASSAIWCEPICLPSAESSTVAGMARGEIDREIDREALAGEDRAGNPDGFGLQLRLRAARQRNGIDRYASSAAPARPRA